MDVKATVDVGQNLTSLIEKLAQQIGTTADKVFPWYIQQAYIEGVLFFVVTGVMLAVILGAVIYAVFKAKWEHGEPANLAGVLLIVSGLGLFALTLVLCLGVSDAVTKIYNPQYHAMKMLTRDISRFAR